MVTAAQTGDQIAADPTGADRPTSPIYGYQLREEQDLVEIGVPGAVVITRAIGHDPWNRTGTNFELYAGLGADVICRLEHGEYPQGTLPFSQNYGAFARRCANFVAASSGCHIWVIGNEPNFARNWPRWMGEVESGLDEPPAPNEPEAVADGERDDDSTVIEDPDHSDSGVESPALVTGSWWQRFTARWRGGKPPEDDRDGQPFGIPIGEDASGSQAEGSPSNGPWTPPPDGRFHALTLANRQDVQPSSSAAQGQYIPGNGATQGYAEVITPRKYVGCYRLCRRAIRAVPGHENDIVLVAGLAPWTNHARYAANPSGDWLTYLVHVMGMLSAQECDGIALHIYEPPDGVAGAEPGHGTLGDYARLLHRLPEWVARSPVYVTECGPVTGWSAVRAGWLDHFAAQARGLFTERPMPPQMWVLGQRDVTPGRLSKETAGKIGLAPHMRGWEPPRLGMLVWPGQTPLGPNVDVLTTTVVNLRRTPGYVGKTAGDIIAELAGGVRLRIVSSRSTLRDGLQWWQVQGGQANGVGFEGWIAETSPGGQPLFTPANSGGTQSIRTGGQVRTLMAARIRRTPGYLGKPDNDVLGEATAGSIWTVRAGPTRQDDLVWWDIEGEGPGGAIRGWVAETAPGGLRLFAPVGDSGPDTGGNPVAPPDGGSGAMGKFRPGDRVITLAYVRMRRTPGIVNKSPDDVIADVWAGVDLLIRSAPQRHDGLVWYEVETTLPDGAVARGWMAESAPGDVPLLGVREERFEESFELGELVTVGGSPLRVRRSAGVSGKPEDDVLGEFMPRATLNVLSPVGHADGMRWWRVGGIGNHGGPLRGWVAQATAQGVALVRRPPKLAGTDIPNRRTGAFLGRPFAGRFGISQLWGQNPEAYGRFTYDGVRLMGHNGIDFLTPTGTPILATESGVVATAGFEAGGFGNYVLMEHAWGQSIYAHLDSLAVSTGQSVVRGHELGRAGSTGNSTGAHLHFAIRIHPYTRTDGWGGFSDPLPYMAPADVLLPGYVQDEAIQDVWPPAMLDLINIPPVPPSGMLEEQPGMVRP